LHCLPGVVLALVPAQGMVVGDFDQNDPNAVGIFDPHLDQAPWLQLGRLCDGHVGCCKSTVLGGRLTDLQPECQALRALLCLTRYLQQPVPEEEDDPRLLRWAELAKDRKPEDVAVERLRPPRIRRSQQDTAAQYLHGAILVWADRVRRTSEIGCLKEPLKRTILSALCP
jgi:hypothetical protein